ncbi:Protein of unknown function (DUF1566) [Desulfocapsa sulfexigens DSM 10523]|uniref:Lcl C-terminal domain-containing protein n=1 Tax=Desulfocapsa sulfexigens (strain DSM 10523 / SB164P1) TaxID=1167006 RepID=M1PEF9_DESSD|nr:DUF1566 domain-containing protein [Desulfocapsa sulfexigens]AGF79957.1 Protein of unknown function (DUF1566) [Desulfocapsa sulfexigens DSM 10523]
MFTRLQLSDSTAANVEWDMTPDLAFCTFSAKGLRDDLSNSDERVCYFFVDNYGELPRLYLMERGTRFVNILAEVKAPIEMLNDAIISHGSALSSKDNFPVDAALKAWLISEVVERENSPFLFPTLQQSTEREDFGVPLPVAGEGGFQGPRRSLPQEQCTLSENQLEQIITQWNFYDTLLNPLGEFTNALTDSGDGLTVIDEATGIMWQRSGLDLSSIRKMTRDIEELNKKSFAGYHDWRFPTVEEAMSLMETSPNAKGLYLHSCFSKEQPFIFVAAKRSPTGYWFVDYKQGKVYWSSGTVPGGFARLCRNGAKR